MKAAPLFLLLALVLVGLYQFYYAGFVSQFDRGADLYDAGWFVGLFETVDPQLPNPPAVDGLSFYNYHLSPLIYLWAVPATQLFGLNGVQSFSLFHLTAGALIFLSFALVGIGRGRPWAVGYLAIAVGAFFALTNEFVWTALLFPHFETMQVALSGMIFAALLRGWFGLAVVCAVSSVLLREDGGFFAAYSVLVFVLCRAETLTWPDRLRLGALFGVCFLASIAAFWIKGRYFDALDLFAIHFVGDDFAHVTPALLLDRLRNLLVSNGSAPILIWPPLVTALVWLRLTKMDLRLVWGPLVLMSPLILVYMMAVLDLRGHFHYYYGLPFALIAQLVLLGLLDRWTEVSGRPIAVFLAGFYLLTSSMLFTAVLGSERSFALWWGVMSDRPTGHFHAYRQLQEEAFAEAEGAVCATWFGAVPLATRYERAQVWHPRHLREAGGVIPKECLIVFAFDVDGPKMAELLEANGFTPSAKVGALTQYRRTF